MTRWQKEFIQAAVMDRSGSYYACVWEELPHADVVFDKFHLVKNFNEVVDKVSRDAYRNASDCGRSFIKGQRHNQLSSIPREVQQLKNLRSLYLHENLNLGIPADILGPMWGEVEGPEPKNPAPPGDILANYFGNKDVE